MERNQERNRLRIYKIYAFGVPLLISGAAAMRHSSSTPGRFCETEYWFAGKLQQRGKFCLFNSSFFRRRAGCLKFKIE